jgi:TPR repeat protein
MNNLGYYYHKIEKNYDMMKKYYMMAIDKDYSVSMRNLGYYYRDIEKDYRMMKKYEIMSKLKSANKEDECMVCYENKQMYYTSCNRHYICNECSVKLYCDKCPMCRQ